MAREYPTELTPDLIEILGRPNFACGEIAHAMRAGGQDIPRKAEGEQAAVIHWMLGFYLEHGPDWRMAAGNALNEIIVKANAASVAASA